MKQRLRYAPLFLLLAMLCACDSGLREVDDPFYVGSFEPSGEKHLFRCLKGPDTACAIDGLPDAAVLAAGANRDWVTISTVRGYYYFARVPEEKRGWGNNPEKIVGPLDAQQFQSAAQRLKLPDLKVQK